MLYGYYVILQEEIKKNYLISDFAVKCKGIGIDGKLVDQDANLYRLTG